MMSEVPTTANGIPIRNLWYMLLYAWNQSRLRGRWSVEVENAPTLDALLASILADHLQQRLRIGIGRNYCETEGLIRGIRGRVDFEQSMKRGAIQRGQTVCSFQTYSPNVPKNQIIRSTLARLAILGAFGNGLEYAEKLRHRLRTLVRALDGVDMIALKPELVRRQQLQRDDADYRIMLAICYLVAQRQMPTETAGGELLPGLDRDSMTLHLIFEKFVASFYHAHLVGWAVTSQATLQWPAKIGSPYLPALKPDLVLRHCALKRAVVLDTKFTAAALVQGQWGNWRFSRNHLFQMYAYLRSQEEQSNADRQSAGILLYPTAKWALSEVVEIQGHRIRWETVDLSQPWEDIEEDLLKIPDRALGEL